VWEELTAFDLCTLREKYNGLEHMSRKIGITVEYEAIRRNPHG
jgi:hypothetical protein